MKAPQRFIYVIGPLEGAQKVGLTSDPKARLATLQTGCSQELVLHLAMRVPFGEAHAVERRAHRSLERSKVKNEWFDVTPEGAIAAVLAARNFPSHQPVLPPGSAVSRLHPAEGLPLFAFERVCIGSVASVERVRRDLWQVCRAAIRGR